MRRHDREMSREFGIEIIDKSEYGVLSTLDENGVFAMPLSLVRKDNFLYFHSAKQGRKVEAFKINERVQVTFVGKVQVPNLYSNEELDTILENSSNAGILSKGVFTTEFESAISTGTISLVEDADEKAEALRLICIKYVPSKAKFIEHAINSGISATNIYKISMDEITAKRKKFDSNKEEMKFQRME